MFDFDLERRGDLFELDLHGSLDAANDHGIGVADRCFHRGVDGVMEVLINEISESRLRLRPAVTTRL